MRISFALAMVLGGCADDAVTPTPYTCLAAGGAACFQLPTKPIAAADAFGKPAQPVLDCGPYEVRTSAAPVTFRGTTVNALDATATPLVHVEAFEDLAMTRVLGETVSDELGAYSLTIPAMPSQRFVRTFSTGALPVHVLYERTDVASPVHDNVELATATRANLASTLELVGDHFVPGRSQVLGVAVDCAGNSLVNVIANVAPSSAAAGDREYEAGVRTYYAVDRKSPALGRRTQVMQTTVAGRFAASNLHSGRHYMQIWGFLAESSMVDGADGLELLGEVELAVPTTETGLFVTVHGRLR
jgi:hypothetical protein